MMHNGDDLLFLHRREEKVIQAQKKWVFRLEKMGRSRIYPFLFPLARKKEQYKNTHSRPRHISVSKVFFLAKKREWKHGYEGQPATIFVCHYRFFLQKRKWALASKGKNKILYLEKKNRSNKNDFRPKETSPLNFIQSPPQWTAEINCFPCRERSSKEWLYTVI